MADCAPKSIETGKVELQIDRGMAMFTKMVPICAVVILIGATGALTQQSPAAAPAAANAQQFPVTLEQNIAAGKTAVGTKIKAKLVAATLENGKVIPKNAVLTGEVVESAAKTQAGPSRLAIRIDSAEWKDGSAPVKACLTSWYYPTLNENGQNLQYGPQDSAKGSWNGQGQYPDPNSKIYQPFPGTGSKPAAVPDTPNSVTSNHAVRMKDVDSELADDGRVTLVSKRSTIKLDRYTVFVLVGDEPTPSK